VSSNVEELSCLAGAAVYESHDVSSKARAKGPIRVRERARVCRLYEAEQRRESTERKRRERRGSQRTDRRMRTNRGEEELTERIPKEFNRPRWQVWKNSEDLPREGEDGRERQLVFSTSSLRLPPSSTYLSSCRTSAVRLCRRSEASFL